MTPDQPPETVEAAADYLLERFGGHAAALMAYGSRVCGRARTGSAFDFWLIVRDGEAFHRDNAEFYRTQLNVPSTPDEQVRLNRSGPLFYAVKPHGVEVKFAVVAERTFVALCRAPWWTVKGRMQKPLRVLRSTPAVDEALLDARREGARCAVNLVRREFTLTEFLHELVGLSYRAEIRPERKRAKIHSILEAGRVELEEIYVPLIEALSFVETQRTGYMDMRSREERAAGRRATLRALRRSKWSMRSMKFVWRNYRSHRSPIRYMVRKLLGEIEKLLRRRSKRPPATDAAPDAPQRPSDAP